MALNTMLTPAQRRGIILGAILPHAMFVEVLNLVGQTQKLPKNQGDTIKFRRWLPKNATASAPNQYFTYGSGDRTQAWINEYQAAEGVTPNAESIAPQDISCTLQRYSVLFGYTRRTADLYEDDIPEAEMQQTGERIGAIRELVKFGVAKSCTNKLYGGTGTSRASVNGVINLRLLQRAARILYANHSKKISKALEPSPEYATKYVEPSFVVFIHTDIVADVRAIEGFIPTAGYGQRKPLSPHEIGSVQDFRFVASPELVSIQSGATSITAATYGLLSTSTTTGLTGTYPDVYQVIVASADCWGDVALRGEESMDIHDVPCKPDHADPTGERGYIGASCYYAAVLLNQLQMVVLEVAASDLSS